MPLRLPSVDLGGYRLDATAAAPRVLVDADVMPWRPATGVYLLVEGGGPDPVDLVDVPGVAGVWSYLGDGTLHPRLAATQGRRLTVCYLDDDPVATAERLRPTVQSRWERTGSMPLLAAPFQALVPWQWKIALPT
jgi:hypothetical protein